MSDYTLIQNLGQEPLTLPYPLLGVLAAGGQGVVADTPTNVSAYFAITSNDVGNIVNLRAVPNTTSSTITVAPAVTAEVTLTGTQTLTNKTLTAPVVTTGTFASPVLTTPRIVTSINDSGGNEVIKTPATASAVNELTITNAATGNPVLLSSTGGDANIGLDLRPKGTGAGRVLSGTAGTVRFSYNDTGIGFYATAPVALQTGVAVTAGGIHAALVALGLITA